MKSIKQNIIYIVLLLILFPGVKARSQDLPGYLKEAGQNHPGIQAAWKEYYAALEQVSQAGTLPDPKLSMGYFISPVETRLGPQHFKVSLSQMFPWFGTLKLKEQAAVEQARVKYQAFIEKRNAVYKKVRIQWYNLYKTAESIRITKDNIDILESLKSVTRRNYENDKGKMAELLRINVNIRDQQNKLENLRDQLSTRKTNFNLLLNRPPGDPLKTPGSINSGTFDIVAYRDSIRNHPDITALEHKEAALERQVQLDKKQGYPSISLGLDYAMIGQRQDMKVQNSGRDVIMPMVGISIPLYRNKYNAMEKQTRFKLEVVQSKQQEKQNQLTAQYKEAEEAYKEALRHIELYKKQVQETEKIYNLLKTSYSADEESFFELLRTRLLVREYKLKLEKARADRNIAVARLQYITSQNYPS
jgi:outer membrane protein TolC